MRLLTEQELYVIVEVISLLLSGIGLKAFYSLRNFTLYVENKPQIGPNRGIRGSFTI